MRSKFIFAILISILFIIVSVGAEDLIEEGGEVSTPRETLTTRPTPTQTPTPVPDPSIGTTNQIIYNEAPIAVTDYSAPVILPVTVGETAQLRIEEIGQTILTKTIRIFSDNLILTKQNMSVSFVQSNSATVMAMKSMIQPTTAPKSVDGKIVVVTTAPVTTSAETVVLDAAYYGYQKSRTEPYDTYWRVVDTDGSKVLVYSDFATKQVTTRPISDEDYTAYIGDVVSGNGVPNTNTVRGLLV